VTQGLANTLVAGSSYLLVASGFWLIYSTVRFFHLAHGASYLFGAYAGLAALTLAGAYGGTPAFPPWVLWALGGLGAVLISGLAGVSMEILVYGPLRTRRSSPLLFLLASFGVLIVAENLVALTFGTGLRLVSFVPVHGGLELGGAVLTGAQLSIVAAAALTTGALWVFLRATSVGLKIRAVADDRISAELCGVNSHSITVAVFVVGSALAGLGGYVVGAATPIDPQMGMPAILKGIVACMFGGTDSLSGAVVGSFVLAALETLSVLALPPGWSNAVPFVVLLGVLLFRPQGILGSRAELAEART